VRRGNDMIRRRLQFALLRVIPKHWPRYFCLDVTPITLLSNLRGLILYIRGALRDEEPSRVLKVKRLARDSLFYTFKTGVVRGYTHQADF